MIQTYKVPSGEIHAFLHLLTEKNLKFSRSYRSLISDTYNVTVTAETSKMMLVKLKFGHLLT